MKKNRPKISYNKESGVLMVELKPAKSVDSDIHGNVVIDYDKKGEAVRVNLYQFKFEEFTKGLKSLKEFARDSRAAFSAR
ncbi:MAG: DUF2283 domain-containing protein [Candidatus Azambacteria bacterium]|nr:DUF2283 domain-containing protein [Candidatus Azambacteria bacterium]